MRNIERIGTFPFGMPLVNVTQADRAPKKVFVLGVYSSAIHARWIEKSGKTEVNALAVASEPNIFWRGEDPEECINEIIIPQELGKLVPARKDFNGPSGIALDDLILNSLEFDRDSAWLCDLVPHSCVNGAQSLAIERAYLPHILKYNLPQPTVPILPNPLVNLKRREQILDEILISEAKILILLGDQPIKWFLSFYDPRWKTLSDFTYNGSTYGSLHEVSIKQEKLFVLPLAHPRQIARLGLSSSYWYNMHKTWVEGFAKDVGRAIRDK